MIIPIIDVYMIDRKGSTHSQEEIERFENEGGKIINAKIVRKHLSDRNTQTFDPVSDFPNGRVEYPDNRRGYGEHSLANR